MRWSEEYFGHPTNARGAGEVFVSGVGGGGTLTQAGDTRRLRRDLWTYSRLSRILFTYFRTQGEHMATNCLMNRVHGALVIHRRRRDSSVSV